MRGLRTNWVRFILAVVATLGLCPSEGAARGLPSTWVVDREALVAEYRRILETPDVDAARTLAIENSSVARGVLERALWLVPGSESLSRAHARIEAYEKRIVQSESVLDVADEFASFVQIASSGQIMADVDVGTGGKCHYSTGEIIAIVLGFILGILPGIILLVLLC